MNDILLFVYVGYRPEGNMLGVIPKHRGAHITRKSKLSTETISSMVITVQQIMLFSEWSCSLPWLEARREGMTITEYIHTLGISNSKSDELKSFVKQKKAHSTSQGFSCGNTQAGSSFTSAVK